MSINYDDPIKNLPDAFKKDSESNNYKLLQINKNTTDILKSASADLFNALNINNAKGKVLNDIYGGRVHLQRGALTDDQYIIQLRTKMMQNTVNGSFPDLVEALAYALQCGTEVIHIVESDTPNRVKVKDIPLETVFNAKFTATDVIAMVESMLPIGVKIEEYGFTGTFEFGGENEYDRSKGFADMEGNIGGYLGLMERSIK